MSFLSPNSSFFQREPDSGGRKRSCFKHRRSLTVIFRVCCCLTRDMHADYKSWSSLSKTSLSLTGLQFRNSYPFLPALYLQLQILLQRYFSCAHIFSDPASHYGSSGKDVNNEAPSSKITNRNQSITCLVLHWCYLVLQTNVSLTEQWNDKLRMQQFNILIHRKFLWVFSSFAKKQ